MKARNRHPFLPLEASDTSTLRQDSMATTPHRSSLAALHASADERITRFRNLTAPAAERLFRSLSPSEQSEFIAQIVERLREQPQIREAEPDERPATYDELPGCVIRRLLEAVPDDLRDELFRFAGYPEECIARNMTPEFIALRPDFTTETALEQIRRYGARSRSIELLHVVDHNWRPLGSISIRDLLLAEPTQRIADLEFRLTPVFRAYEDRETVAARLENDTVASLPVVDNTGALLGVVSPEEIREIERLEATEDFQKFGGTEELKLSYTHTPLLSLVKKRAGWLIILFLSEMLTASAMGYFDDEIARAVVLALFVPLIISSGGNSGSQAASLIIRALALGELSLRNAWYVLRKEFFSGLLLGAILGGIGLIRILVWQLCGIYDYGIYWGWVAVSVAVSLLFIVLWGTLAGAMIPLLLKRIGLDPATASAPFVATLVDVTGLIIYFSIAALFLNGKLL